MPPLYFCLWFLSFFFFLFSSPISQRRKVDVYHTHDVALVWECRSEMCCTRLAGNTGRNNDAKNRHLRTIAQLCRAMSSQLRHRAYRQSEKMLNSNISSRYPHNMANFGPLTAEIGSGVWGTPANFNGFESWLRYCSDVAQRRPTKLCTIFGRLLGWCTIRTFSGALASWRNFATCKIYFASNFLRSPVLPALLHGTPAAGFSQTSRNGTNNGITELSHLYSAGRPSRWALPTF